MDTESRLRDVTDRLRMAAFDGSWDDALEGMATLCGGHTAELLAAGPSASRPFYRAHNMDPAVHSMFLTMNGGDPARNARIRAGMAAPILRSMTEADFGDVEAVRRSEIYAAVLRPHDIPYTLQTTLMRSSSGVIGTSICYSERHGMATAQERRMFDALTPHMQTAVRLQRQLEDRGMRVLRGAMENLGAAVFICNAAGRVVSLTPEAERLAAAGDYLVVKDHLLAPADMPTAPAFAAALLRASTRPMLAAPSHHVSLRSIRTGAVMTCQIASLPEVDFPFGLDASTMVLARIPKESATLAPLLRENYGLTGAETGVVLGLARGLSLEAIARERGSSRWTVRTQLRTAASKLGVSRQAELVAKISQL